MRGISNRIALNSNIVRFNPAYAGNIKQKIKQIDAIKVQPRVCGEYVAAGFCSIFVTGSTPRMRGIFKEPGGNIGDNWFNPAYAGNMKLPCKIGDDV